MFRGVCATAVGLLVMFAALPAAAQSVEDIEKKLTEAHAKVKSMTAKTMLKQDMDLGEGNRMQSDMTGTIEMMRKGDKMLMRNEVKGKSKNTFGGQVMESDMQSLMISDGDFLYTVTDNAGQKMAMKNKFDPTASNDPKAMLSSLKADHNLKVLPDEKVDGVDAYVIEVTAKDPASTMPKTLYYFAKDSAVNLKMVGKDKAGKEVMVSTTSDVKINSDIAPDRFVFKAPEGVQVMDMSGNN